MAAMIKSRIVSRCCLRRLLDETKIDFPVLAFRDSEPNASRFALVEDLFVDERRMLSSAHH